MTTFNWSTLTNGQSIAFNPNVNVLAIDDTTISAADLGFLFTFNVRFTSTLNSLGARP
jgi:hypothetical protein